MKIAWLFPGQGAQAVGMGKDIAEAYDSARQVFALADDALGEKLSRTIFDGPAEQLTATANAQPAIVATSTAVLAAMRERYPTLPAPTVLAGHSLGEYSALVAAEALTLGDAIRLVRTRGEAMQAAVPKGVGTMAAVMAVEADVVKKVCADISSSPDHVVQPANFNAPGQIVIAGHVKAVEEASARCSAVGGRVKPLSVSAPFHCDLMQPAADALASALANVDVKAPKWTIMSAALAEPFSSDAEAVRKALVHQVRSSVRWVETFQSLVAQGVQAAIEIGPGKVLQGLGKRIDKAMPVYSVPDAKALDGLGSFLEGLG